MITCPDLQSVCALIAEDKLTDAAYNVPAGLIIPLDIPAIARSWPPATSTWRIVAGSHRECCRNIAGVRLWGSGQQAARASLLRPVCARHQSSGGGSGYDGVGKGALARVMVAVGVELR